MNIRLLEIEEPKFPYKFSNSASVFKSVKDYGKADREVFLCLLLNSQSMLIDCEVISVGTVDCAAVYTREVVKAAIMRNASSVILAHNHPSGDLTPSHADLKITAQIMLACSSVEIKVLDHIIMGRDKFSSMADSGQIERIVEVTTKAILAVEGNQC